LLLTKSSTNKFLNLLFPCWQIKLRISRKTGLQDKP
jgi:hypothetical protein